MNEDRAYLFSVNAMDYILGPSGVILARIGAASSLKVAECRYPFTVRYLSREKWHLDRKYNFMAQRKGPKVKQLIALYSLLPGDQ